MALENRFYGKFMQLEIGLFVTSIPSVKTLQGETGKDIL